MTASISRAGTGMSVQLRSRHSFLPWKRPQSTRTCKSPELMRCLEPVTVPAAPKNWIYAMEKLYASVMFAETIGGEAGECVPGHLPIRRPQYAELGQQPWIEGGADYK